MTQENLKFLKNKRKIIKAILYRIFAISSACLIFLIVTGDLGQAGLITVLTQGIQTIMYFLFDSLWTEKIESMAKVNNIKIIKKEEI